MKEIDSVIDVPIKDRIEQYFRSKVLNEANLEGGFNNRLFKISLENGMDLLLKQYFDDERNRLNREYRAFEYLKKLGEMHIPTPLFRDDKDKFAVYSFETGNRKTGKELDRSDIDQIISFISKLQLIKPVDTNQFESAIFSTVSLSEFTEKSILFRLRKFDQYVDKKDVNPIVKKFARDSNVFGKIIQNIESIKKNSTDLDKFSRKMDDNQLRLSPVDFGPHNMIFKTDGTIIFIDFEYFGWDDPIKIVSNFVFHEGSIGLSRENKEYFLEQYKKKSSLSTNEIDRLDIALKLSEIDWISILLWSLTPEKILSRKFSSIGFDENKYLGTIAESINHRLRSME